MAQEYTVSNAFLAKDKAGNVKIYESQYGNLETWNVYFVGDDTKWQWQRKEGSEINKGDIVYGNAEVVERGGYKFPTFKSEARPLGELPSKTSNTSSSSDEKLDYMIGLLEAVAEKVGAKDVILEDIEDGEIDLSDVPF